MSLATESERSEGYTDLLTTPVRVHRGEVVSVLLWFLIKPPERKVLYCESYGAVRGPH